MIVVLSVLLAVAFLAALAGSPTAREVLNVVLVSLGCVAFLVATAAGIFAGNGNDRRVLRRDEDELVELARARSSVDEKTAPWIDGARNDAA